MSAPPLPDRVLFADDPYRPVPGSPSGDTWSYTGTEVTLRREGDVLSIDVASVGVAVSRIVLRWNMAPPDDAQFLGDHWERAYGDLAWRGCVPERVMPWYFLCHASGVTAGWGIRTGAASLCFWTADASGISLWLDLRCGAQGVRLGGRTLRAADVVSGTWTESPFVAARELCRKMCPAPRLTPAPVYGANDFYYAYGRSTHATILRDSATISELAGATRNRPFSVIDDQWQFQACCNDAPWTHLHPDFPDMTRLAREIRDAGCRPGLWTRPLLTFGKFPESWTLPQRVGIPAESVVLDPSVPEVLEKIRADLRTMTGWGYELIKHDFSTFDLLTRWGFEMGAQVTAGTWKFQDDSRTTAEIITALYRAIREGSGDAVILGCNTIGHLGAGLFELQRIGDDTSGRQWERTRRMGINTLAFRMGQQGTFFTADADCVGLTQAIPWNLNRQWLELLAESGTALFVSAAPEGLGPAQRAVLRDALAKASQNQPPAEPLDWLQNTCPRHWKIGGEIRTFDWFGHTGASPFMMA